MPQLTNQSTITTTSSTWEPPPQSLNGMDNTYMNDKGGLYVQDDVVISDKDKMVGEEHEDAVRSPLKGSGVHITSEVSY